MDFLNLGSLFDQEEKKEAKYDFSHLDKFFTQEEGPQQQPGQAGVESGQFSHLDKFFEGPLEEEGKGFQIPIFEKVKNIYSKVAPFIAESAKAGFFPRKYITDQYRERIKQLQEVQRGRSPYTEPTFAAPTKAEKEFMEKYGRIYEMATAPKTRKGDILQGEPWSKDPKVNYYSEIIASRAPMWLTAFAGAPSIIGLFEVLNQMKNITMSVAQGAEYDPLARRMLSELVPEDSPEWLKTAAFVGEGAADMLIAGLAAKKISGDLFDRNVNKFFDKAKKMGWFEGQEEALKYYKNLVRKYARPGTIEQEIKRMSRIAKEGIPSPVTRQLGRPTVEPPSQWPPSPSARLQPPAGFLATEGGTAMRPDAPEREAILAGFREVEPPVPEVEKPSPGEVKIDVTPKPEGGAEITIKTPEAKPKPAPAEAPQPLEERIEQAKAEEAQKTQTIESVEDIENLIKAREGEQPTVEFEGAEQGAVPHAGTAWSPEAVSRMKKINYFMYNTQTKGIRPIIGVDAVDIHPGRNEVKVFQDKRTGKLELVDKGPGAVFSPANLPEIEKLIKPPAAEPAKPKEAKVKTFESYPGGFNKEGYARHKNVNKWRESMQPLIENGWVIAYVQGKGGREVFSRIIDRVKGTGDLIPDQKWDQDYITSEKLDQMRAKAKRRGPSGKPSMMPLINWIRKKGGISLSSIRAAGNEGEVQGILEDPTYKGLIKKTKGGEDLQYLTQLARQDGRIDSDDPAELIRALTEEISGRKAYPSDDEWERYQGYTEKMRQEAEAEEIEADAREEWDRRIESVLEEEEFNYPKFQKIIRDDEWVEDSTAMMLTDTTKPAMEDIIGAELKPGEEITRTGGKWEFDFKVNPKGDVLFMERRPIPEPEQAEFAEKPEVARTEKPEIPQAAKPETPTLEELQKAEKTQVALDFEESGKLEFEKETKPETKPEPEAKPEEEELGGAELLKPKPGAELTKEEKSRLGGIEWLLEVGDPLSPDDIRLLKKAGIPYEDLGEAPKPKPPPAPETIEKAPEKMKLVRVTIKSPAGGETLFGKLPADRLDSLKKYVKKKGREKNISFSKPFLGKWTDQLGPAEQERTIKELIRAMDDTPVHEWKEWEDFRRATEELVEDIENKEVFAGLPPPKGLIEALQRIEDKLQIEPQFRRIGGPRTGLALKLFYPRIDTEVRYGENFVKKRMDRLKGYSDKDFQDLLFIASKPGKFAAMDTEARKKFSKGYQAFKDFREHYAETLQKEEIIEDPWPASAIKRMQSENIQIREAIKNLNTLKDVPTARKEKLQKQLKENEAAIAFLKKARIQYVPITRIWLNAVWEKDPDKARTVFKEFFTQRKTLDIEALANHLLKEGLIEKKDLDIRRVMMAYSHQVGRKIAISRIFQAGKQDGLIKPLDQAPADWPSPPIMKFPSLKGMRWHPALANYIDKQLLSRGGGWFNPTLSKVFTYTKLFQFYNPFFLPMYDTYQSFWTGALTAPKKTPVAIYRAFKSMAKKDQHYWDAGFWGAFSTPFTPTFKEVDKITQNMINKNPLVRNLKRYINPYHLSWDIAWTGDNFIRMITYHHYLQKGFSPMEAAQLTAKPHGDYASIPPKTRVALNKILFTPSFRISMMAAQSEMMTGLAKLIAKEKKTIPIKKVKGKDGSTWEEPDYKSKKYKKAMARIGAGVVGSLLLQEYVMHQLGFETDQWGLKYTKRATIDGEEKELVVHLTNPANVFLRYFHRYKGWWDSKNPDKWVDLVNRARWELHPMWQLAYELLSNQGVSGEPIARRGVDPDWKVGLDMLEYATKRIFRLSEAIWGMEEGGDRMKARKALVKDLGAFGVVLNGLALPYVRNTKEKRLMYEYNRLKRLLNFYEREKPWKTEEAMNKAMDHVRKQIRDIQEELSKIHE